MDPCWLSIINIGIKHIVFFFHVKVNAFKNNVSSLYCILHTIIYSPKFMKIIALYYVSLSQSIGVWAFPLIFVFQGQAIIGAKKKYQLW